jgi:ABC-type uncharacterized transport system substrate-binding protein
MRSLLKITLVLLVLQGCATPPVIPAPVPDKTAQPAEPPRPAPKPAHVDILVSENIPAYMDVARELAKSLGQRATLHTLTDSQLRNLALVNSLKPKDRDQIVAIGLSASIAAKRLGNRQMVFCQVFNYQDYGLISSRHKGISMLPSPNQVFRTWHSLAPAISDIGVITGPGFEAEIENARAAARTHQITLHHETVKSDKEYQFAFKKLSKKVQGYWLVPDNRVLSANSLRDIMNFSVYNSKMVAVFNNELLKLGGLFSINSDVHDIARLVEQRLEQGEDNDLIPGPDILYPEKLKLKINSVMVRNLGIEIPEQYRKYADAP